MRALLDEKIQSSDDCGGRYEDRQNRVVTMDVSIALGGGGVKGFAHIGVIRRLEQYGFRIRAVAGTSIGGLVGVGYALGYTPDQIEDRLVRLNQNTLYKRNHGDGPSLLGLKGVIRELETMIGDRTFSDLKIPFACTAVDLETGQLQILENGRLVDAILATIALPGVFPPKRWSGRLMIDGGVLDPVPVELARLLAPGLPVVAVVMSPSGKEWKNYFQPPEMFNSLPMINRLYRLRLVQSLLIYFRAIDIAGTMFTEMRLEKDRPEAIIRPITIGVDVIGRVDVRQVIQSGEQAAEAALPSLRQLANGRKRSSFHWPWLSDLISQEHHDST